MGTAAQAIARARADVGYKETPANSNRTKFGRWYGLDGNPWCAMAVSYWVRADGTPLPVQKEDKGFAYTPAGVNWAKANGRWVARSGTPKPGDLVFFEFPGGPRGPGQAEHVGIVAAVTATTIRTVEGNISATDPRNGGSVGEKTWKRSDARILGYLRPAYAEAPAAPKPRTPEKWESDFGGKPHRGITQQTATKAEVDHLQYCLRARGHEIIRDGDWGPMTMRALVAFQRSRQLNPDGKVDGIDWRELHTPR